MTYRQVTFTVPGARIDPISDALIEAGALSVDVADADAGTPAERAAYDEPGQAARGWSRGRVSALFAADADVEAAIAAACRLSGTPYPPALEQTEVADHDWVRLTRDQFKPIRISPRLWIVPSWERAPDPEAISLRLDPGLAFGTGSHPSTRLCLQWLDANLEQGAHVLDYGCGSGILAIAAAKLGAARVDGVDIDAQAVTASRDNAMQNGVAAQFHEPGAESDTGYHVVLANILANPLIALAPLLSARTLAGGHIVLSGILEDQAAEVASAYSAWYDVDAAIVEDGWALLVGRRRGEAPA